MLEKIKKIFISLMNGGVTPAEYKNISPIFCKENRKNWHVISILASFLGGFLFILSFFFDYIAINRYLYLGLTIYSVVVAFSFKHFIDDNSKVALMFFIYFTSAIIYFFGIYLGTFLAKDEPSITFMVMLVVIPLVINDKPYRLILMSFLAAVTYNFVAFFVKEPELFTRELFDTVIYFLMGAALNMYIIKNRFRGFLDEYIMSQRVYIDALTGNGSEFAYLSLTANLNNAIKAGVCEDFAVVVMDVNNVKTTNDKYGHVYGCSLIVETGAYIRSLFSHSRTFHVGGDEFIAILRGEDYKNRESLIAEFDRRMENYYIEKEGVVVRLVVARGMSEFEKTDKRYKTVFNRADSLMYENKKYVKQLYNLPNR